MNVIDNIEQIKMLAYSLGTYEEGRFMVPSAKVKTIQNLRNSVLEHNIIKASMSELTRREGKSRQAMHRVLNMKNKEIVHVERHGNRGEYTIYTHPMFFFIGTYEE